MLDSTHSQDAVNLTALRTGSQLRLRLTRRHPPRKAKHIKHLLERLVLVSPPLAAAAADILPPLPDGLLGAIKDEEGQHTVAEEVPKTEEENSKVGVAVVRVSKKRRWRVNSTNAHANLLAVAFHLASVLHSSSVSV